LLIKHHLYLLVAKFIETLIHRIAFLSRSLSYNPSIYTYFSPSFIYTLLFISPLPFHPSLLTHTLPSLFRFLTHSLSLYHSLSYPPCNNADTAPHFRKADDTLYPSALRFSLGPIFFYLSFSTPFKVLDRHCIFGLLRALTHQQSRRKSKLKYNSFVLIRLILY
jgi:hypothetical protein